jgi:hypothetical protein
MELGVGIAVFGYIVFCLLADTKEPAKELAAFASVGIVVVSFLVIVGLLLLLL